MDTFTASYLLRLPYTVLNQKYHAAGRANRVGEGPMLNVAVHILKPLVLVRCIVSATYAAIARQYRNRSLTPPPSCQRSRHTMNKRNIHAYKILPHATDIKYKKSPDPEFLHFILPTNLNFYTLFCPNFPHYIILLCFALVFLLLDSAISFL